ncbi:MAG: SGNH/GDSL hydrolase family protein [Byssovorax sp.]
MDLDREAPPAPSSATLGRAAPRGRAVPAASLLAAAALLAVPLVSTADPPPEAPAPRFPNGTVVHFGDSFVDSGLSQTLRPRFSELGTRYVALGKFNTMLGQWANSGDIESYHWAYRPSLFIVTLGASEVNANPPEIRLSAVKRINKNMKDVPCVWISVPLWKGAPSGLTEMIRRESAPCRHFDSSVVADKMTRQSDHVHPDAKGGALWADAFWTWLQQNRDTSKPGWALKPAPPGEHGPSKP